MKIAYFFVFLVFAINISAGIVTTWIGDFTEGDMGGAMPYNKTHTGPFMDETFESKMSVAGSMTTAGSTTDTTSLLDLLGLGFIQTWINAAKSYMYGISSLAYSVFAGSMTEAQRGTWFGCEELTQSCMDSANGPNTGIIGIILSSMWVLATIAMFTGKSLFGD